MREQTATELASTRDHYMIDVRPLEERRGGFGFVPGSLALGSGDLTSLIDDDGLPVVLYCMSGRRSAELIEGLPEPLARRVVNMEGGLLAWINADFSVAMSEDVEREPVHVTFEDGAAFLTGLRSCFIGQLVETILEFDLDLDPLELFEQLEARVLSREHTDAAEQVRDLIDHAAHLSRILGTPLEAIASNTEWAYENVERFASELPACAERQVDEPEDSSSSVLVPHEQSDEEVDR